MANVEFDYKKVTPTDMVNFAKDNLSAEQKAEFKKVALVTKKKDGKDVKEIDKLKARKYLFENNIEGITWKNAPSRGGQTLVSIVENW